MIDQENQKPNAIPLVSRPAAEDRYPALMAVLKANGKDAASVGLFKIDAGFELRFPERLENAVTAALEDGPALDAAALEDRRALMLLWLNQKHADRIAAGFTADLPDGGNATFQIRPEDQTNWLTAKTLYADAIAAGQDETEGAHMRDAADQVHVLTFSQAHAILAAMAVYGAGLMRVNWAKKDAIKTAANLAALDAVHLDAGWPG